MTGPRSYSAATRAALALLSRGRCYNPDCERPDPIIVLRGGEPYIDYEIAHIRDAEPGNRYVADMTVAERRAFANLVLLCTPCHKLVDRTHPGDYSIERRAVNNLALQSLVAAYAQSKAIVDESSARAAVTEVTAD